jgi:hypothetical protein
MAKNKTKKIKSPSFRKMIRRQITDQLQSALTPLKDKMDEKKFERRIKKAAKLLTAGIKANPVKEIKIKSPQEDKPVPEAKAE